MQKQLFGFILAFSLALVTAPAFAKCYQFDKAGGGVRVCVKGDSFDDRKIAKKICDKGEGKDCGNITSSSSSCHSNSNRCYDETGKAKRDLSGY